MARAVAQVFRVLARAFGPRFRALAEDPNALVVWDRKFRSRGVPPAAVRAALGPATDLEWPPTLGEYLALCRPAAPTDLAALAEAMRWRPGDEFAWSHPAIAAAALDVTHARLHSLDDRQLRALWADVYRQMLERWQRGESMAMPTVRALPAEVRTVRPRGAPISDSVAAEIAAARRILGIRHV